MVIWYAVACGYRYRMWICSAAGRSLSIEREKKKKEKKQKQIFWLIQIQLYLGSSAKCQLTLHHVNHVPPWDWDWVQASILHHPSTTVIF